MSKVTRRGQAGRQLGRSINALRGDPRRVAPLAADILERARAVGIDRDCGILDGEEQGDALKKLDAFLCELKDLQIRDCLHVFGESPARERLDHLLLAIARARRGSAGEDESLIRALAADLGLGDPLAFDPADPWTGPKPDILGPRRSRPSDASARRRSAAGSSCRRRSGRAPPTARRRRCANRSRRAASCRPAPPTRRPDPARPSCGQLIGSKPVNGTLGPWNRT